MLLFDTFFPFRVDTTEIMIQMVEKRDVLLLRRAGSRESGFDSI